ncbi:MAG: DASS family sodium-coupled anion symporter [Pirellulaceae bacterium]|nr:DASS family sodium-coupled anion symporter [Pirellulaceae bacterium]
MSNRGESPPLIARLGLVAGPLLAVLVYFLLPGGEAGLSHAARACGGVAVLMAVWWMTEALPLEATALLPLVLLPLAGVYSTNLAAGDLVTVKDSNASAVIQEVAEGKVRALVADGGGGRIETLSASAVRKVSPFAKAAAPFADSAIFLFLGGFLIALAIEKWGLHRRIALLTILAVGAKPTRLIGGFMLATALISMWISNTATTVMMLPIGMSVVRALESHLNGQRGEGAADTANFATCLLLGLAYAASLGGFATLIGTPPNVFFRGFLANRDIPIDFGHWILFALPLSLTYLLAAWWIMTKWLFPLRMVEIPGGRELIRDEYQKLGPLNRGEWIVAAVFLATATLWITRGWLTSQPLLVKLFPPLSSLDDSLIAMAGAIALFLIPVDPARHHFALDWQTALKLPWGVLLLFGGGLSLAEALTDSGLARWIGLQVSVFDGWPTIVQIVLIVALIVFTGELTSNLAAVVALMPILFEIAGGMKIDPLVLCVPAVIAASCGFMLPVATPPNAIVFASGHIRLDQMVRAGLVLDLLAIFLIPPFVYTLGVWALGIKLP